jgi:hypothetical protein
VITEGFNYQGCHSSFPTYSGLGRVYASKLSQVVADTDDGLLLLLAAFSLFGDFRCGEGFGLYHITDEKRL